MSNSQTNVLLQYLHKISCQGRSKQVPDAELLRQFLDHNDESAFTELVRRHGPMVFAVCRSALRHEQDAEDCFQATFLVLARKAGTIRKHESVASWLHGVAFRVACNVRRKKQENRWDESREPEMRAADPLLDMTVRELQGVVSEELDRLPAAYRTPLVLCCLEGRSQSEAAQLLGWSKGKLRGRLNRARARMRERLKKRGFAVSAGVFTTVLAAQAPSLPAQILRTAAEAALGYAAGRAAAGTVPARIVSLAEGVIQTMIATKCKTILALLLAIGLAAAGAGATSLRVNENQKREEPPAKTRPSTAAERKANPPAAIQENGQEITVRGRVLDSSGKPLAGAEISLWAHFGYGGAYRQWHPETAGTFRPRSLAVSGRDGRFTATFRKSDITENPLNMWERPWRLVQLVAAAKGYGPDWVSLDRPDTKELILRLVKDNLPVKGRVLDLEGQPVAGAAVRIVRVTLGNDVHHSLWQPTWAGLSTGATTDRKGRFTLSGVGRGRNVLLSIEGDRIEQKLVLAKIPAAHAGQAPSPEVEILAGPSKPIEGTIRIKGTGKPLAGVVVYGEEEAHERRVRAVTDAQGRYRLLGLPKASEYRIVAYPPVETGCLSTLVRVTDTVGLEPVAANMEVRRGVPIHCRMIDKATRQPVRGEIRYSPLVSNPLYREAELSPGYRPSREFQRMHVPDPDGVFHFVAYPGSGILIGMLQGNMLRYLPARIDPADDAKAPGDALMGFAKLTGVYRLIEPNEGDKQLHIEIELDPGRKATGALLDPDGKPVSGATAYGLNHHPSERQARPGEHLPGEVFTATLLSPDWPRTIGFVHKERRLIAHSTLRGEEKPPVTVRMEPWGVLTGRLVDSNGKPLSGVRLELRYREVPGPGLAPLADQPTTRANGRFRIEGLVPRLKFDLTLSDAENKGIAFTTREALKGLTLEPGQTKDLGEVRVKATAPAKKAEGPKKD